MGLPEDDDVDASKEENAGEEKVIAKPVVITRGKLICFVLGRSF